MADTAVIDASTSSATSGASAPASTSVSSGTASEAMLKAVAASESAAAKPVDSGATGVVTATDTKVQTGADGKPTTAQVPPEDRWPGILDNARKKASEEATAPFAWAKDLKADEVSAAMQLVTTLRQNPAAFWRELGEMVNAKSQPTDTTTKDEPFPDPDYTSQDGGKFYSADALKKIIDLTGKQLMQKFQGELRPLVEFREGELQTRTEAQAKQGAQRLAGQALTSARALPHFKEHEPEIVERLQAMDPNVRKAVGPIAAMYMAFEAVKQEKVYPTLNAEAEKRVRAEFDKKAAASGVHPVGGDGKVAETPAIKGVSGIAAHLARLETSNDPRLARA